MTTAQAQHSALMEQDDFSVFIPSVVEFSLQKGGDPKKERKIGGMCSTERRDRQDEIIAAKGLDFSEFVNYGWFNDNHKQDMNAVLGYPEMAVLKTGKGWYTEGYLLKTEKVDEIWELAKALQDTNRRFGFSIEGKVIQRGTDSKILKARVRNVAITHVPVNTDCTWEVLSKAFAEASAVEEFDSAHKSLTVLARKDELTFDEAVNVLRRIRPSYSWSTCERIARSVFNKGGTK